MGLLQTATKGKIIGPDFIVIHGPDGVGKTTFAAGAPKCLILGPEKGSDSMDVTRLHTKSYPEFVSAVLELTNDPHEFMSLGVDSLDHLEPMIWDQVCRDAGAANIESAYGGYGKGYVAAQKLWDGVMDLLLTLREKRKMNIILIAHSILKPFNDPQTNSAYDRYQLKLNDKAAAIVREKAENVFFANFQTYTKEEKGKKTKAFGDGTRKIYTERRPGYDAKNRLTLPDELALDWNAYIQAKVTGSPERLGKIKSSIAELVPQLTDLELKAKVETAVTAAGDDPGKLMIILNRLRTILEV